MSVVSPVISHIDGNARRIYLNQGVGDYFPIEDIYHEYRTLRRLNVDNVRNYNALLKAEGNVKKGGGAFTPRYVVLLEDTKIIPYDETLQLNQLGDMITDDPDTDPTLYDTSTLTVPKVIYIKPSESETIVIYVGGGEGSVDANIVSVDGVLVASINDFKSDVSYLRKSVYVDTEALSNGNGSQGSPFDNVNDGKDYAELHKIKDIYLSGAIILPTSVKNMNVHGVGIPEIDFNGHDVSGSKFNQCEIKGAYTGSLILEQCHVINGLELSGHFDRCEFLGNHTIKSNVEVTIIDGISGSNITNKFSLNSSTGTELSIKGFHGNIIISDMDHASDLAEVNMSSGSAVVDTTCVLGIALVFGGCKFTDNNNGTVVIDETYNEDANIIAVKDVEVGSVDDFKADLSGIPQAVWEYASRTLTQTIFNSNIIKVNGVVVTNIDDFKADVSNLSADVNVVAVAGTAVSGVDDFKADVSNLSADVNIVEVNGVAVESIDDFKADLTGIDLSTVPQEVWEYTTRELTATLGLTAAQEAKIDQLGVDISELPPKVLLEFPLP